MYVWFVFSVSLTHHQSVMDVCTREGRIAVFLCYLMFVTSAFDSQQQHPIHKEREREKKRQRERETNSSIIIIIIEHERIISLYPHISSSVHSLSPASFSWTTRRLLCCCCCHSFLSRLWSFTFLLHPRLLQLLSLLSSQPLPSHLYIPHIHTRRERKRERERERER